MTRRAIIGTKKGVAIERLRRMKDAAVSLRPCRLGDLAFLRLLFDEAAGLINYSEGKRPFPSLPRFTIWLLFTFDVFYLIETHGTIKGFVGLYRAKQPENMMISIMVFNPDDRRKGYGTRAMLLLLRFLRDRDIAEEVAAEIQRSNLGSLAFFSKAGFEIRGQRGDNLLLSKKLSSTPVLSGVRT